MTLGPKSTSILALAAVALSYTFAADAPPGKPDSPTLRFAAIADCQFCSDPGTGVRKYSLSPKKLQRCVDHLNSLELDFAVHLGDFIDRDFASFDVVAPIYDSLRTTGYHVLGNHDFSVADEKKAQVPAKLGLTSRYYDFLVDGWRFVALDGNDISFHAHPAGSPQHRQALDYYEENNIGSPRWNGAVGPAQLTWLEGLLKKSTAAREKIVLFCHFPIFPENPHNLWNAPELIALIERYPAVKAYLNGHNHAGNYALRNGVHYLTLKGMVDTSESSYATVDVHPDRLVVHGHGREQDRVLPVSR